MCLAFSEMALGCDGQGVCKRSRKFFGGAEVRDTQRQIYARAALRTVSQPPMTHAI